MTANTPRFLDKIARGAVGFYAKGSTKSRHTVDTLPLILSLFSGIDGGSSLQPLKPTLPKTG
jgi:hypothetical protein